MHLQAEFLGDDFPEGIVSESHINVPGLPSPMPLDTEAWIAWVPSLLVHRVQVEQDCTRDYTARRIHDALCKQPYGIGQIYFACTFGWIFEPREDDDMSMVPFVLYPEQALLQIALDACMRRPKGPRSSLAVPKARGVGATWNGVLDDLWRWKYKKGYQARFASRSEEFVDKVGDSDSYFWKLDYIIDRLPQWLVPQGYSTKRGTSYRSHMSMLNPENGNAILGEAQSSGIGVGRRCSKYTCDEFSRFRDGRTVHGQLDETTNHRVYFSTHNINISTDFWDMTHGINGWDHTPVIFEMPWHIVPGRDEAWLENTRRGMTPEMFAQEVLMNPFAGRSAWVYPMSRTMNPVRREWQPSGGLGITGMDDGYDDSFAIGWAQYERSSGKIIFLDGYQSSHKPLAYYGSLLRGIGDSRWPWDSEAIRLMPWITRHGLWRNIHVGDRHGDNTDLTSGVSPWTSMQTNFGITVMPSSHLLNDYKSRRDALGEILDRADFSTSPGAWAILEAIQNNRYPEEKTGAAGNAREFRAPIHDQTSHFTSMAEYIATYVLEHFMSRSYGLGSSAGESRGSVSNGWLRTNVDPYQRAVTRTRPEGPHAQREGHNGWIR